MLEGAWRDSYERCHRVLPQRRGQACHGQPLADDFSGFSPSVAATFDSACAAFATVEGSVWNARCLTLATCARLATFSFAVPARVSFATFPRPSAGLGRLVTSPRGCRSATRRLMRLVDRAVELARSAMRVPRLGASERHVKVAYSLIVFLPSERDRHRGVAGNTGRCARALDRKPLLWHLADRP